MGRSRKCLPCWEFAIWILFYFLFLASPGFAAEGFCQRISKRLARLPGQLIGQSPFTGTLPAQRLPIFRTGLLTLRHYRTPLKILDAVFEGEGDLKYLDVPGFSPILFVRDPEMIREITVATANKGDFDRDTMPTQGIGRVVGTENLLYAQGETWKKHKGAVARPFGTQAVQTPEVFNDLERALRESVAPHLQALADKIRSSNDGTERVELEPEIKSIMLGLLVKTLFGSQVPHEELRYRYLPAIENVIGYIMWDTIANRAHLPVLTLPAITPAHARLKQDRLVFEELVDRVIETRSEGAGFWPLLTAEGTDEAVRSNVRVFLAGALEATTSYLSWTLSHLARNPEAQEKAYREAVGITELTPQSREQSPYLKQVLAETLRLTPSLYFLPRIAMKDTSVTTSKGTLTIPKGTHIILAAWHTNRSEAHWGSERTGYPALAYVPERWDEENLNAYGLASKDTLHFGFGHGPRVCVGKHFAEAEAFVFLNLFLKTFEVRTLTPTVDADSGVSTRPADKVEVEIRLRHP